jgi:hypothetical protein
VYTQNTEEFIQYREEQGTGQAWKAEQTPNPSIQYEERYPNQDRIGNRKNSTKVTAVVWHIASVVAVPPMAR